MGGLLHLPQVVPIRPRPRLAGCEQVESVASNARWTIMRGDEGGQDVSLVGPRLLQSGVVHGGTNESVHGLLLRLEVCLLLLLFSIGADPVLSSPW